MAIQPALVEKDYWIMHVLYGLKKQNFQFELKGGTSLSKGFEIIDRFSEDIDIHISPPVHLGVNETGSKPKAVNSRRDFYDWLCENIEIDGIIANQRDTDFDNVRTYTSGGIRLIYESSTEAINGLKNGILLEAGFDNVAPNELITISSWAVNRAIESKVEIIDNRAVDIACYHPGYTFVEKLQTIVTKFRKEQENPDSGINFMRQYYDVYSLLENQKVLDFIGTSEYYTHKEKRFSDADKKIPIQDNQAFILDKRKTRDSFIRRYAATRALYYRGQPDFDQIIERIQAHIHRF
ncbi:nucleotidyl transferase AbiEii/AbiGii toxin family protein [Pedobacter sp. SYP-B3415]|uniref:nucleotidyl transferase AbiEii/AbiGii toxin family protein n=1 Tax=Pedobacter sp. SYP-B3415 TaxID=2496641 RepID=UPI001F114520|nr:nucleotidyl transferase AbiEii/AbiGii toxin family protein [Pedobacter sp. SYP-B3415]